MKWNSVKIQSYLLVFYLLQTPFDGGGFELYQQAISTLSILLFWVLQFSRSKIKAQDLVFKAPVTLKYFVIFLILSCLSVIWSVDRAVSSWVILYWVNHFLFLMAVYRHFSDRNEYMMIIKQYVLPLSAIMSIWGIYQFWTVSVKTIGWEGHSDWGRSEAMFAQANSLGGYLSIILVLLIVLYLYEKRLRRCIILYFFFLLIFTTFITTYSRASWVSFFISASLFLFLIGLKHIKVLLPKLISLLSGMVMIFMLLSEIPESNVLSRVQSITAENYMPTGLRGRITNLWIPAWKLFLENPLVGTGVGTYHLTFYSKSEVDYSVQIWMAHNDYVQFLSEIGFIGTAAIITFLIIYLFYGFRMSLKLKKSKDLFSDKGLLVIGVYAATLSPILHSIVDFDLRTSGVFALFLFLSSMVWHESEKLKIVAPVNLNVNSKFLPYSILKIVLGLLAFFILYLSATTVIADYYFDKALKSESEEAYISGISYAKKAVSIKEGVSSYHEFLGRNYMRYALFAEDSLDRVNTAFKSEEEYLLAIKKSRMTFLNYLGLADLYQKRSDLFDSVDVKVNDLYEKAIQVYPANNNLRFKFAEILMRVGLYDEAIESLEHTLGRGRRVSDAQTLLAEAYRLDGRKDDALVSVENKLSKEPDDGFANFIKGNILADLGRFDESINHYTRAIEGSDGDNRFDAMKQLALTYLKSGDTKKSEEALNNILTERPEDRFSIELLGFLKEIP
ncbi:tetratricopeptide repeat protein [Candidatus Marinimicrobia bacterium MT.SAG.3]|nr:tetratricopeptide repeat protein [Candidatus Marinimicrobia bacterium MT.SAG.3]